MRDILRTSCFGYGLAVLATGVATGLYLVLQPFLGNSFPYITFFPAIFITAYFARLGPTLLAVVLSGVAAGYWIVPPGNSFFPENGAAAVALLLFNLFGVVVALLGEWMHRNSSQLARERERYAVTLASIGDGVIVTDGNSRVVFMNAVAEQLTGWTLEEAENEPLTEVFKIIEEATRCETENPVTKALRQGSIVGLGNHTILIAKNQTERAIDDSAAPIRDRNGSIIGVVLVFRDVSQQRAAQIATGRLAALVDSSEDAILAQNFDGIVEHWNAGAERLFGWSAEEAIGRSIFSLIVPPDRQQELREKLAKVQSGERVNQFETIRQTKTGRQIPVAIRISPIQNDHGQIVGASSIDRDISNLNAAERRRNARMTVTQVLAEEEDVEKAVKRILAAVCGALRWNVGAFWRLDLKSQVLRCEEFWQDASRDRTEFHRVTRNTTFERRTSLPGRAWQTRQPVWIQDVATDPHFVRAPEAKQADLHGAFACPVILGEELLGVLEFFSHEIQEPDEDLLEMMATVCGQIGQFIERRRAVQAVRRSEQELADFFENAAVGLHWLGPDGTILRVNQAELDMLGYTREEYLGRHIAEFHEDPAVIEEIFHCLRAGDQSHAREARLRCKDGSIKDVLIDSNVLWEDGQFIHTRCFTRDITKRKQAEAALHDSEERLRLALEAGQMGTWEWKITTGEVIWSPTLEAIHGLEPGTFPGTFEAYQSDIHPDDRERVLETIRRSVELGQPHQLQYRITWPDQSIHWLESRGRTVRDDSGQPVALIGVCSDITARKRLELSLRFLAEASKSLSSLVDYKSTLQKIANLAVPAFADWCTVDMLDAEDQLQRVAVAHVDPAKVRLAEKLYRRYPSAPKEQHGAIKVLQTGESEVLAEIRDEMLQQSAHDEEHLRILRELRLRSYICVPLQVKTKTLGVITFVAAESGRQYGKGDLTMAEDLAHRAAIAVENARLYQELREADRRKDEFLAMLAHELRNPLAPIRSGLDVLSVGAGNDQEIIALMQEQVAHVVRLVDDLLDVSRIMRGKVGLRKEPIKLSTLIKQSVQAVKPSIEAQRQTLSVNVDDEPIWLNADPIRLVQVIENLLNNASKYTDAEGHIELRGERHGDQAIVTVRDTGIGIEPELLPNVFELFTQSSRSLDRAQGGLGIGLTLVQKLVEMHDGNVSVHSEGQGHGSLFTVRLPVREAPSIPKIELRPKDLATHNRRILVVDDTQAAARMLSILLTRVNDGEVETAHDGYEAMEKIESFHPEIVFLDIGLPGMNGYQVARKVRENSDYDDVLLVALTGYGQPEDRRKSMESGFDEHLVKPPSLDQIREMLAHPKLDPCGPSEV